MARIPLLTLVLFLAACSHQERTTTPGAPHTGELTSADAQRLPGQHWRLVAATDASGTRLDVFFPRPGRPLQLDFVDGRVAVSNGCNAITGNSTIAEGALSTSHLVQTRMACAGPLMQADTAMAGVLHGTVQLRLEGDTLVLTTTDGKTLRFEGEPTADARFSGPGQTVFLEVAAQRVVCHHPEMPDYRCLSVRDVDADEHGVLTPTGDWQSFYGTIEGYTHQPGVRNVLRVTRYEVADPPTDGSSRAYALDMVVESEAP